MKKIILLFLFCIQIFFVFSQDYILQIKSLETIVLQNSFTDEMYFKISIDGNSSSKSKVYNMHENSKINFTDNLIYFYNNVYIELWEEDVWSGDDTFGSITIQNFEYQKGLRTYIFRRNSYSYRLIYEVYRN